MVKIKLGKKIKKSLKKFNRSSAMNNPTTQYIVLLIAISVVLFYLHKKDYNSLIMLIATGLLTNYFTKNMTITLGVAIIGSLIVRLKIKQKEGFEEGSETKSTAKVDSPGVGEKDKGAGEKGKGAEKSVSPGVKAINEEVAARMDPEKMRCFAEVDGTWIANNDDEDTCVKASNCYNTKAICSSKQGFAKRVIPSSQPESVGEDEVDTDRIDYAKTLEQAYDNLQGMLGKDGISGLTSETSKLVEQQSSLMSSLKGMGPMLKEAKTMMAGMKDIGSMDTMKDMKSLLGSIGKK